MATFSSFEATDKLLRSKAWYVSQLLTTYSCLDCASPTRRSTLSGKEYNDNEKPRGKKEKCYLSQVSNTANVVAMGILRLSFPYGRASAIVHDKAPKSNCVHEISLLLSVPLYPNITIPTNTAVIKHAVDPDTELPLHIFGDDIVEPTYDATGSAIAKHSTAYLARYN